MAYVHAASGNFITALAASKAAGFEFLLLNDLHGVGETLVDRGLFLMCQAEFAEAVSVMEAALRYLDEDRERYMTGVALNLGFAYWHLEQLEASKRWAARALQRSCGLLLEAKLEALQALIGIRTGEDLPKACRSAERAIAKFQESPLDRAISSAIWVKALLTAGRHGEAQDAALGMIRLLGQLHRNKHAAAAVTELINVGARGELAEMRPHFERLVRSGSSFLADLLVRPKRPGLPEGILA